MARTIQIWVDDELKTKSDNLFRELETEVLDKLEKACKHADQGEYRDAAVMVADMRAKYGL